MKVVMWVDFKNAHFKGFTFVYDFWFKNYGENSKKILTGHKLNQIVK